MFDPVNEPTFRLDVAGLSDAFEVLAFSGSEALSEPFAFDIDVLIEDAQLDLAGLLHRSVFLHFGASRNGIHGQLHSVVQQEHGQGSRLCRARLGPKLNCLDLRFSQRVFSACSVPQILAQVLKEHGIAGAQRRFELVADYPELTFCTQYRESDLQLLQRLCARAGIHYHFEHRSDGHCLVFGDDLAHLPRAGAARFDDEADHGTPAVRRWRLQDALLPGAHGAQQARRAEGESAVPSLRSGRWLPLAGHPFAECNREWLLSRVEHHADLSLDQPYRNRIFAVLQNGPALAGSSPVRPRMHSLQRAWVVAVDEPRPDCSRPVAVQFDWLYQGEGAAASHCWLPLAPALAGKAMLREGDEVVVSFLEGDPDQPVISGVLQAPDGPQDPAQEPIALPEQLLSEGLPQLLKSAPPLVLLCLMPGGGSFSHCRQAICSCRLVGALEQSGRG
ncbi:type VI secretion protein [Pseudomonas sp. TH43]|uniref:type VI secretion system Vgr family protein n=1 Tax=Pseudomonas sp. TH43 TaxID=2796407 RepID=UPI001913CCFD|nr:contractile injection system protein, VgrG/Pvc8 family [Pseudomonas sp. TH43]MBK5378319.1 type VI secretion protein [Pseudomonas sp. TH43]